MKQKKNHNKHCRQSVLLQKKIDRQKEVLMEASNTIFNNVGQSLSRVKMDLALADIQQADKAEEKINTSHEIVGKAITDLRQLGNHIEEVIREEQDNS